MWYSFLTKPTSTNWRPHRSSTTNRFNYAITTIMMDQCSPRFISNTHDIIDDIPNTSNIPIDVHGLHMVYSLCHRWLFAFIGKKAMPLADIFLLFCCYWCRSLMPNTMCGGTMHTETTRMKQISYCYFINGSAFFWYFVYIDDHRPWREMASLLCLFFDTNTAKAVASTQLGLYEWITKHVYFRLWLNCAQCHYYITIPPEWEWAACKNKKTNKHQIPAEL